MPSVYLLSKTGSQITQSRATLILFATWSLWAWVSWQMSSHSAGVRPWYSHRLQDWSQLELHVWRSQRVTPNGLKVIWRSGRGTGSKSLTISGTLIPSVIPKAPCAVALASPRKRWHSIHLNLYTLKIWWTYTCVNHGSVSPTRYSHFHDMVIWFHIFSRCS
jgi:hypothetical protein